MKVKVCGITGYGDAKMVLDHGADALGFNFFPRSPRYLSPADARSIIRRLPVFAVTVGLFVNVPDPGQVHAAAVTAGVHVLQLHGDENPEYCAALAAWPLIKAVRVGDRGMPENLADYHHVRCFLLDVRDDVLFGGTGRSFDWSLAKDMPPAKPFILAGGLRPDNVRAALGVVDPCAVDVCSGVESAPGKKDPVKMEDFMNEVRNARQHV
ncbi:MAG TPA: phosphoribosylanthranilate isomerase [Acidobacteriota bacterium]|nr:phosphoribosylanthranilate isomerase [Acidobacteriota bacterium]